MRMRQIRRSKLLPLDFNSKPSILANFFSTCLGLFPIALTNGMHQICSVSFIRKCVNVKATLEASRGAELIRTHNPEDKRTGQLI